MKKFNVFLGFGGNIGNSKKIILEALNDLKSYRHIELIKTSNFYKTTPVSNLKQRYFINCACFLKTSLSPFALQSFLQEIEKAHGKVPKEKNQPRTIDIDILFFDTLFLNTKNLQIPHPQWFYRLFVLKPLSELALTFKVIKNKQESWHFNLEAILKNFENKHNEKIILL